MLALVAGGAVLLFTLRSTDSEDPDRPAERTSPAAAAPAAPPTVPDRPAQPKAPAAPATVPPATAKPTPSPTTATLRFDSDVPGASVFIDRKYLGTTPITVPGVAPGSHRINASVDGYEGIAENIEVQAGAREIMLKFKEIRLDVRLDVVHKHGVGSCAGVLTATPQGVKYTTSHASDAFEAPLGDITALEFDYLAKNLRLKLKSGKTYNFTEAGGGADQLYVFQRDVDKIIKKKNW